MKTSKHELYENEKAKNFTTWDVKDPQKMIESRTVPYELAKQLASQAELPEELWHYLELGDYHTKFYRTGNHAGVAKGILEDATLVWKTYHSTLADKGRPNELQGILRFFRGWCNAVGMATALQICHFPRLSLP